MMRALAPAFFTLALAACGSSPPSTFYALSATQGSAQALDAHSVIRIRRPGLAGYLDRSEIVRRVVDFKLGIAGTDRWGEPLDAMIGRVLAEDLEQRLPGSSAFTEDGAITADPDVTVEVDVRRFDVGPQGEVNLVAEVAVERATPHATASRGVRLSATPADGTTAALVSTMSDLLGQLADRIGAMIR